MWKLCPCCQRCLRTEFLVASMLPRADNAEAFEDIQHPTEMSGKPSLCIESDRLIEIAGQDHAVSEMKADSMDNARSMDATQSPSFLAPRPIRYSCSESRTSLTRKEMHRDNNFPFVLPSTASTIPHYQRTGRVPEHRRPRNCGTKRSSETKKNRASSLQGLARSAPRRIQARGCS